MAGAGEGFRDRTMCLTAFMEKNYGTSLLCVLVGS